MRRWLKRVAIGIIVFAALVFAGGWLAFVPSAKEPGYEFIAAWGSRGAGPGQFRDPTGIALTDTEVFVADARNGRIQVFDYSGTFKRQFGKPGKKPGELSRPMNLTIAGGELYVAEYWNDRIQVFALDGTPKRIIGSTGKGPGQFDAPGGVAVAANGDLWVTDFYNQRVQHLRADGSFVGQLGVTREIGIGGGSFNYPTDVALAPNGDIVVADGYNDRVQVFDPNGALLRKWGGPFAMNIFGPFRGWFATVTSVVTDKAGNIFVADFYNNRVQKFAVDGTFLTSFGKKGAGDGQINYAMAVAVAKDGTVFVADFGNNRIEKWRPKR